MSAVRPVQAVLFDLDGTLADTAPDLAYALNQVLAEQGRAPLPYAAIRPEVSHGSQGLLRLGFGLEETDRAYAPLRLRLLDIYQANLARATRLFPGMEQVLTELEARAIAWGVVTNKPAWLTEPLLEALGLRARAACVVSGDTLPQRKPDPVPMLLACRQAGCAAAACLYVGDAQRDVEAGRRAGMTTLVALYGYLGAADRPHDWGADGLITTALETLEWLGPT